VGDATYLPGGTLGELQTLETTHQPLCLHSSKVKFRHPLTTEWVAFASPPPGWAE
jgi:23S rRNA-/tRNA-specific pseudouridylate synthase